MKTISIFCSLFLGFSIYSNGQTKTIVDSPKNNVAKISPSLSLISTLSEHGILVPKIDIIGSKDYDNIGTFTDFKYSGSAKLFISTHDRFDKKTLFVPEFSNFGFDVKLQTGPSDSKDLKFFKITFISGYYGKKFAIDSVKSEPVSIISLSPGIQFNIFRDGLSVFGNLIWSGIATGSETINKISNIPIANHFNSWEIGIKSTLDLPNNAGNMKIQLNFIRNTDSYESFTKSKDWCIPVINISYSKSFEVNK